MDNFIFQNPTRILFGRDMEDAVGAETARYARKVLIHYGGGSVLKSGLMDRVVASLHKAGVEHVDLGGAQPNPRLSLVREGIRICREQGVALILAIGGGSAIDSAKAIAMGVPYEGDVWDFYAGKAQPAAALPVATVLTIPAAGSEASNSSVITNEDGWFKRGHTSDLLYPVFSILNPERMFTLPAFQVACGAADIMAHMMERYFTNSRHVETTDRIIEGTLRTVIHNVPRFLANPGDYDAAAEIMWSGTLAHNNVMSTGRVGDWASHDIEHELSGIYDVAHGAGLATVFPAWMKYVFRHDLNRFAQFAERVWGVESNHWNREESVLVGMRRHVAFYRAIGLPVTLAELGAGTDRLEEMADKATAGDTRTVGQFVKLKKHDVLAILELAKKA